MTKKTVTQTPEPKAVPDPEDSLTDEEWGKQRLRSHDRLVELGLLDRDDLVFRWVHRGGARNQPGGPNTGCSHIVLFCS